MLHPIRHRRADRRLDLGHSMNPLGERTAQVLDSRWPVHDGARGELAVPADTDWNPEPAVPVRRASRRADPKRRSTTGRQRRVAGEVGVLAGRLRLSDRPLGAPEGPDRHPRFLRQLPVRSGGPLGLRNRIILIRFSRPAALRRPPLAAPQGSFGDSHPSNVPPSFATGDRLWHRCAGR